MPENEEQQLIWKYNRGLITYQEFREEMERLREDSNNE